MTRKIVGFSLLGAIVCVALLVAFGFFAGRRARLAGELPPPAAGPVDFVRDVRPILAARCVSCHGEARQRAELRLDRMDLAMEGGRSGRAIVPGRPQDSLLFRLVAGRVGETIMPPKGEMLSPEEIGILRSWIAEGARSRERLPE